MKILYLSYENSDGIKTWSGTTKSIRDFLAVDNDIITLDNLKQPIDILFKLYSKLFYLFGYRTDYNRNNLFIKLISKRINKKLKSLDFDLVFAPGTLFISYLTTNKPIVVWADATFADLVETYPQYSKLPNWQLKSGHKLESKALNNAAKVIFAASWCLDSATNYYNIEKEKLEVIPFGSNIKNDLSANDIINYAKSKDKNKINLMFIGADWDKKGGDILLDIYSELKKLNPSYELDIVGSKPNNPVDIVGVRFHGFLDKSKKAKKEKLDSIFKKSHYFILPSKAEAFGIVVCEANSYGLPVFANCVGGFKDTVKSGINGELFDIKENPKLIAAKINDSISKGRYETKSLNSFNHYENNFRWETSIEKINKLLKELVH